MAYTQTQLETAFKNAAIGTNPTAAQTLTLQALATQNASGQLTDAQALSQTINLAANSTTDVSVGAYQFFLGFAPSVAGLTALNAAYTGTGAQVGLNGENRFIAQSVALATQNATAKAAFTASYGSLTVAEATAAAYNIIIGNPAAAAAGVDVAAAVAYLSSAASVAYYTAFVKANTALTTDADIALAVKAAIVGEIMYIADSYNNGAGLGSYATATNNLVIDLSDDGKLTADNAAGISLFTAYPAPSTNTPFALTVNVDTLTGTSGNDTFNAGLAINPGNGVAEIETLTALDTISGGAGVDTLNYLSDAAIASFPAATITGVEIVNLTSAAGVTADVSAVAGITTLNAKVGGANAAALTTKGNVTSASVTGTAVSTADFTDSATTDTLATVSVTNATALVTVTSDALTSLTLNAAQGGATVTAAAATRALNVTLTGLTAGTITDATATGLTLTASGTKSSGVTVAAAAATTVTIAADEALTVAALTTNVATKLTVTGDSAVTVSAATVGALTAIDASASTGGVTFTPALGTGVLFTGGAGKDSVSIGATTKAITTGAGDDTVTFTGTLGTDGTISGGEGTDTLVVNAATYATNSKLTGFETLGLGAAAAGAFDATGFTGVAVTGAITGASSFTAVAAGTALTYTGGPGFGVSYVLADATGTTDVLNVTLSSSAALAANTLTAANIETINITATDTNTTAHVDTLTLVATSAKVLNVTGSAGLNLTNTGNTALKTFDAHLSTGDITYVSAATTGSTTILGSATGANTLTAGATADTITGGAKADTIVSGTGLDILTGGGGNDTYTLVANTNGNIYATITDANKGDVLTFAGLGTETFTTAKVSLAGTAVFQDYLNEAAKGVSGTNANIAWFQFGGDTYVVEDLDDATSFVNGTDIVVKLTGLVDLSTATGAGTHILTIG